MATPTSSQDSPLFNLAAELRNMIYRFVLTCKKKVKIGKTTFIVRKALLETCSQIHDEACGIFYSENIFVLILDGETVETSAKWLKDLGRNANLIGTLEVGVELSDEARGQFFLAAVMAFAADKKRSNAVGNRAMHDSAIMREAFTAAVEAGLPPAAIISRLNDDDVCRPYDAGQEASYKKHFTGLIYECSGESGEHGLG